jgi:cobalt-zinc-cadmium efflux system membrane fusion protein
MNRMKKHILFSLLLLIALVSCREKEAPPDAGNAEQHSDTENRVELTSEQIKVADVETGKIEQKQIGGTIKVNGVLDVPPQQLVSVSVPLGGFLKSTSLLEGSRVRKGEVIAVIDNIEFIQMQQDYLEAKSQLELAAADYDRQQELAKENVNSRKTLQQSKSNFETWQARFQALNAKLKAIHVDVKSVDRGIVSSSVNLYSPIDGYVTKVNVNIGKFVSPTDVLFEIVDTKHLHAELLVFEKDVPRLRIGQKVRFTLANETKERMATIYLIGRAIADDRTVQIHCHIDKEDTDLLPGMYLRALVETGTVVVPALPNDAIVDYEGRKYIFLEADELHAAGTEKGTRHFEMLEIQVSESELGYTQVIVPDSVANRHVVVKGAYTLISKLKNSDEDDHAH